MTALTDWRLMTIAEPELAQFEQDVLAIAAGLPPDANRHVVWARALKPRLRSLVGFQARVACLQSPTSYDVAYDRLYGHLFDAVETR